MLLASDWEEGLQHLSLEETGVVLVDKRLLGPDWQKFSPSLAASKSECLRGSVVFNGRGFVLGERDT